MELTNQKKHYGTHLSRTTKEIKFRDSKTAKSRKYAQYLNCTNPVVSPKLSLGWPHLKTLKWMNTKKLGENFMEPRSYRNHSEVRKFQEFRNQRNMPSITEGHRRANKFNDPRHIKGLIEHQFGRKGRSLSNNSSHTAFSSVSKVFNDDRNFYSKLLRVVNLV